MYGDVSLRYFDNGRWGDLIDDGSSCPNSGRECDDRLGMNCHSMVWKCRRYTAHLKCVGGYLWRYHICIQCLLNEPMNLTRV